MKKIAVTGATSMIGIALIEECVKKNIEVSAIVRKKTKNINRLPVSKNIHILECDLEDLCNMQVNNKGYDVFYHLAWTNTIKNERCDPKKQLENIKYTVDAVELAYRMGCTKFIGAGSQAEYGIHGEKSTKPSSILQPIDAYGISKMAAGKLGLLEAKKKKMSFIWVRIFSVYGKYENPNSMIQVTLQKLLKNENCDFSTGTQMWDYLYSSDAGRAFLKLGDSETKNNYYCLGSGNAKPLKEYIYEMQNILHSNSKLNFGIIQDNPINRNGMCADITTLTQDTGWVPEVDFIQGIKWEVERLRRKMK